MLQVNLDKEKVINILQNFYDEGVIPLINNLEEIKNVMSSGEVDTSDAIFFESKISDIQQKFNKEAQNLRLSIMREFYNEVDKLHCNSLAKQAFESKHFSELDNSEKSECDDLKADIYLVTKSFLAEDCITIIPEGTKLCLLSDSDDGRFLCSANLNGNVFEVTLEECYLFNNCNVLVNNK